LSSHSLLGFLAHSDLPLLQTQLRYMDTGHQLHRRKRVNTLGRVFSNSLITVHMCSLASADYTTNIVRSGMRCHEIRRLKPSRRRLQPKRSIRYVLCICVCYICRCILAGCVVYVVKVNTGSYVRVAVDAELEDTSVEMPIQITYVFLCGIW